MLPNPLTPLAFLPPETAYQVTVANYATAGSLAVRIWFGNWLIFYLTT